MEQEILNTLETRRSSPSCQCRQAARYLLLRVPMTEQGRRVSKGFDVRGKDETEVDQRVRTFLKALRRRHGEVIRVRWHSDEFGQGRFARIVYELPADG